MGLFFKKKRQETMDMPPPPPEGAADIGMPEEMEIPDLPALEPQKLESTLPELPSQPAKLPEFPDMPEMGNDMPDFGENLPTDLENEPKKQEYAKPEIEKEEEPIQQSTQGPMFLNITSFQDLIHETEEIKRSIKNVDSSIKRMNDLKTEEENEFDKWRKNLEDVEKKLNYVDMMIFKGE